MGKTGLVLPGGGAKGAYQVGVLKALAEMGTLPDGADVVSCTSVGAVNGLAVATYPPGKDQLSLAVEVMETAWLDLRSSSDIYRMRFPPYVTGLWHPSLAKTWPLRDLLRSLIDPDKVISSGVEMYSTAVDLLTGDIRRFRGEDLTPDFSTVMASSALPVLMPPEEIDGGLFLDGGLRDIAPVGAAIRAGCDEVFVIPLRNPRVPDPWGREDLKTVIDVALRSIDLLEHEVVFNDIRMARLYNRLVEAGAAPSRKKVALHVLSPSEPLGNPWDFNPERIRKEMELGYNDVMNGSLERSDTGDTDEQ